MTGPNCLEAGDDIFDSVDKAGLLRPSVGLIRVSHRAWLSDASVYVYRGQRSTLGVISETTSPGFVGQSVTEIRASPLI